MTSNITNKSNYKH